MNETGVRPPILQFTGGNVSGNNNVWRKFQFSSITTTKIRVLSNASPDGYSRLTEVEAWGNDVSTNVALSGNGAAASASSIFSSGYPASGAVDGDRRGANWGSGGGWNDAAPGNTFPDWLEVDFSGSKTISKIDVFTEQDNSSSPSEPTETMTFSSYGLSGYEVQYWNGSAWTDVMGGNVSGNDKVWRKFQFSSITTSKIRVLTNASADGYSRITELEAWTLPTSTVGPINYVLSDIQGSTRAVMNNNGSSSAIIARHDYLPFGEEIGAGLGLRTTSQGYGATDTNRQKYGLTERDDATGLDHTWWRKYENLSGRWTSPDPYNGSASIADPQSFHRYNYTKNDPVNFFDPTGLGTCHDSHGNAYPCSDDDERWQRKNPDVVPNAVQIFTLTSTSLFGNYFLPAWESGHSPMIIGLIPGPHDDSNVNDSQKPERIPTRPPAGPDQCAIYKMGGRPDLAWFCRKFPDNEKSNRMRRCLLDHFSIPRTGSGGYVEWNRDPFLWWLQPILGPNVHADCIET